MVEEDKRVRSSSVGASRLNALSALRMRPIHSSWLAVDGAMPTGAFADQPPSTPRGGVAWKPTDG